MKSRLITDDDVDLICRVARRLRCDCWLGVWYDKNGIPIFRDLENRNRRISARQTIDWLDAARLGLFPEFDDLVEKVHRKPKGIKCSLPTIGSA